MIDGPITDCFNPTQLSEIISWLLLSNGVFILFKNKHNSDRDSRLMMISNFED